MRLLWCGRNEQVRERDAEQPQWYVDPKHAAPTQEVNQHATDQWAGGRGEADHRRPEPQHRSALAVVGVGVREQAQRAWHEQRSTDSLKEAGRDERLTAWRYATEQGCEQEQCQAALVDGLRAPSIGQGAAGDQECGER